MIGKERRDSGDYFQVWPLTVGQTTYRLANWSERTGLWQFTRTQEPKLVVEGSFLWPVITPDGKWAVLAQSKGSWADSDGQNYKCLCFL